MHEAAAVHKAMWWLIFSAEAVVVAVVAAEGGIDGRSAHEILRGGLHWGFGESQYLLPRESEHLSRSVESLREFGSVALDQHEILHDVCGDDRISLRLPARLTASSCRRALDAAQKGLVGHATRLGHAAFAVASDASAKASAIGTANAAETVGLSASVASTSLADLGENVPSIYDWKAILAHHWAAAALSFNRTRAGLSGFWPDDVTPGFVIAAWSQVVGSISRQVELLRWHLTYHLFFAVFRDTGQSDELPPLVFHPFCCSNAEVIVQIAEFHHLIGSPTLSSDEWGPRIVEVGVETGETSRLLLEMLPPNVRLVGVDPFFYGSVSDSELTVDERWQRQELDLRYDKNWLEALAVSVEQLYANVTPAGRARLLRKASPGAASDPSLWADGGTHFVFVDGDHAYAAVNRDLAAWFRLLNSSDDGLLTSRPASRRVLAGHDFTHMHVGVVQAVGELAMEFCQLGFCEEFSSDVVAAKATAVHLAANGVWWIPLPLPKPSSS
eukprot:TRINITY_DN61855_c0_g1_i1.p1 TRINITY_DN61855_c0_g1~~TRINITY_DN61855_c0_g1_i1.p1  ORF type:complete len:531 (+),score=95.87 TRINITY_DN61855_c0_g1_i1:95-1594(+)